MGIPPEKWGPYFWGVIHIGCLVGTITPEFINMYPSVLPCSACGKHFTEVLQENPFPDSRDPMIMFQWSVHVHNVVNARIGKPILTVEEALEAWTSDPPTPRPPPASVPEPFQKVVRVPPRPYQFDFKIAAAIIILIIIAILIFVKNK